MSYRQIRLIAFTTFILTVLQPVVNLPMLFQGTQVLAQTPAARKAEADRLLMQGIEQSNNSQFVLALQSFQEALIIYRQIKDRQGEGVALGVQGVAYLGLGDQANGIASLKQALVIAKEINNQDLEKVTQQALQFAQTENDPRKAQADRLLQQGIEQYKTSQFAAALQSWQQALIIYRQIKDRNGEVTSLGDLGSAYFALGEYTKAIEYYNSSLAIAREINDRQGEGASLTGLGNAYYELREYTKAIEYHNSSLVIFREIKDRKGEGASLSSLGLAYFALGNYTKAIEYHSFSLVIFREIKDRKGEVTSLGDLGSAYFALGEYTKAIEYYNSSLAIAREIKYRKGEVTSLGDLGNAYDSLGDYTKAIEYHNSSLAIAREIKYRKGEGNALGNLGNAYDSLGDYTKAIEYHNSNLAIARKINDRQGEGTSLNNLGLAYNALGEYTKAIEYYNSSLVIFREIKHRQGESTVLNRLGSAYRSLGDVTKAVESYSSSLAIFREIQDLRGQSDALGNLGTFYYVLGDYTKAIEYLSSRLAIAREIKDRKGEGPALSSLGNAYYSLGNYTKAIEYLSSSLVIAREIKDIQGEGASLNNLGAVYYKSGNLPAAEKTLYNAIQVWESIRAKLGDNDSYKISIFEQQALSYRTLQQVLIAQNKTNAALEISERGRARAFVELLTSRLSNTNTSQTSQPAVDKPTISLLQKIAKQQNATLVQYSIIYDEFKIDGKLQTKESELYIWVIKPTGEITFRKSDLKSLWQKENTTLAELVTISRESIGVRGRGILVSADPNASQAKRRFKRLHELLITPIADLLPKKDTEKVIFIPQSELFLVPFPALQDEKGKYLIEKHTILTAPSIQVLDLTHKHKLTQTTKSQSTSQTSLIVGNPTMPKVILKPGEQPQQLTPLIWAEKEAKNIASLLNISALTGNKATKTAILKKMPQAGIIHFATHGLLDEYRGIGSAIALAPSGKDDGLLTADEILNLEMNADLVVLSACDTGRGKITGDGVVGLSRSLISAGTASIIVSLWAVNDGSTSFLMTEFYKNREQKLDKATALRKAMLTTKAKYSSPFNWAAFTLIGESE